MQAFDLVDTLVKINYAVYNTDQLVNNIKNAKVIYKPSGRFAVITAQPTDPRVHSAVSEMIRKNFSNCSGVHFVSGGESAVIKAKSAAIKRLGVTDFTDNNRKILGGIKKLMPNVKLWVMTGNGRKPY